MTVPMTQLTVERLAFVRYLYDQGLEQARQPEPFSATAVLSFHDGVEQFLRLAADHLKVSLSKGVTFAGYWKELEPDLGTPLPGKGPMERLNEVRVRSKHHGIIPSATAIRQFVADTTTFFTDATPLVFGVAFDSVDMIDLVTHAETAQTLRQAEEYADQGDYPAALAGLLLAFDGLVDHYSGVSPMAKTTPFAFGPTLRKYRETRRDIHDRRQQQLEQLSEAAEAMQRALRVTALGIDFHRYAELAAMAPEIHGYMNGERRYSVLEHHRRLTAEDYRFARSFVIESAIKAVRADAVLERRKARDEANAAVRGTFPPGGERVWDTNFGGPSAT